MDLSDLYLGEWMSFKCENKFTNMVCAKYSSILNKKKLLDVYFNLLKFVFKLFLANGPVNPTVTYAPSTTQSTKCGRLKF